MAVTSGFFNSLNGDRKYNAEQMSSLFDGIINDGIFSNIGSAFMVTADSANTINIGIGRAWFDSTWVNNDAILPLTLDGPEVILDRIDAVVIEINKTEAIREGRIVVVKGTPSSNASRPELANADGVYQHPIAYIYRKAEATAITQADITNMVGTSECPYITAILQVQSVDNIVAQWESQFNIWFDGLQTSLEGDVAANLASQVSNLQDRFTDLARDKAVYEPLQDSNNDYILDSSGKQILGATVFAEKEVVGKVIGEGTVVVNEGNSFEVGDTLTTARSSPGAEWLLCNGEAVSREDYPELSLLFPDRPDGAWNIETIDVSNLAGLRDVQYLNGYYVGICGSHSFNDSDCIAYATNPAGPWTKSTMNNLFQYGDIHRVTYVNGYYMAVGSKSGLGTGSKADQGSGIVVYSTALNGTWSRTRVISTPQVNDCWLRDIIYQDSYYIAVGTDSGISRNDLNPVLLYSQNLSAEDWDKVALDDYPYSGSPGQMDRIIFYNNQYIAFGKSENSDDHPIIYAVYSRSPTFASKTYHTIYNGSDARYILDVVIDNDKIILGTNLHDGDDANYFVYSNISTMFTSAWTKVTLPISYSHIMKYDNYYAAFGAIAKPNVAYDGSDKVAVTYDIYGALAFSESLDGPWIVKELFRTKNYNDNAEFNTISIRNSVTSAVYNEGNIYIWGESSDEYTDTEDTFIFGHYDSSKFVLPTLVSDNWTQVFIKALG